MQAGDCDIVQRLRTETALAHQRIENAMDLSGMPGQPRRVAALLERFFGFHLVFEPAVVRQLGPEAMDGRSKLPLLVADLAAFGRDPSVLASLPRCGAIGRVLDGPSAAMGALYVVEGSTLGGKLIAKALRGTGPAIPSVSYFDPYGRDLRRNWDLFRLQLLQFARSDNQEAIIEAANATFAILQHWLAPAFGRKAA
jgi:heme oxygenase